MKISWDTSKSPIIFIQTKKPRKLSLRSVFGAGNEARTRDPRLGKAMLYRLSYSRKFQEYYSTGY
jgi:hypothetical protein